MTSVNNEVQTVPLAAYEAQAQRNVRAIMYMSISWVISVIALCLLCVISISYSEEVVTETTTSEVMQDADNYGNNVYAGGDYYDGEANDNSNENNNDPNNETGTSGATE